MKKIYKTLVIFCFAFLALLSSVQAVSVSKADRYLEMMHFYEQRAAEDTPVSVSTAGAESINGGTGMVSIVRDEISLSQNGGWNFNIRRRFNFGQYDKSINISSARSLDAPGYYYKPEKYLYKYLTAEGATVFVAFDTPQQMMEAENGTGTIGVRAEYASHSRIIRSVREDDELILSYVLRDEENTGVQIGDAYLYAPENLGSDVTLTRDKTCGVSELHIGSIYANPFSRNSEELNVWEYDLPRLDYIPQFIRDGAVGATPVYSGIVEIEEELAAGVSYRDRGEFYDPETNMKIYFMIDYSVRYNEDGKKELYVDNSYAYTYVEQGEKYVLRTTDMYSVFAEQVNFSADLYISICRYDGMKYKFMVEGEYTSSMAYIDETDSGETRRAELYRVIDKYGNEIRFTENTAENTAFTDTLGRKVIMTENGITVDDTQVVSYTFEKQNDAAFDPNDIFDVDNLYTCSARNHITGAGATYHIRPSYIAYELGSSDEGDNPHSQTTAAKTYLLTEIELSTGASVHYDYAHYTEAQYNIGARKDILESGERLVKRYMLSSPGSTQKTEETNYAYDAQDTSARKCIITHADDEYYIWTQTFDTYGYPSNDEKESTQPENSYYICAQTTYAPRGEGKRLLTEATHITKASKAAEAQTSVSLTYTYNKDRQLISQTRDGVAVLEMSYGAYGTPLTCYEKQNDTMWIGYKNTLNNYGQITATQAYTKTGDTETAEGTAITYTYTADGNLASQTVEGEKTSYSYATTTTGTWKHSVTTSGYGTNGTVTVDALGRTISVKDGYGNKTTTTYTNAGSGSTYVTRTTYPDGAKESTSSNTAENYIIATDADGVCVKVIYTSLGQEKAMYQYTNRSWEKVYDLEYDSLNRVIAKKVYADGENETSRITYTYYEDGQLASEIVTQGETVLSKKTYTYAPYAGENRSKSAVKVYADAENYLGVERYTNQYGFAIEDVLLDGTNTYRQTYTADLLGNMTSVTDFNANAAGNPAPTVTYTYDHKNRAATETTVAGTITIIYNNFDKPTSVQDARGNFTEYTYKGAFLTAVRHRENGETGHMDATKYTYDKNGNVLTEFVATEGSNGRTTHYTYDSRGRLIWSKLGNQITRYTYTPGNRTESFALGFDKVGADADEYTQITSYTYDDLGRLFSTTDPMGNSETNVYDNLNQLTSKTDRNGAVTTYTYDGLGRTLSLSAMQEGKESESIQYSYDYAGNVTQMLDSSGTTVYNYDVRGLLLSETKGDIVKTYTYDANGNRTSFVAPSININTTYTYDSLSRLLTVSDTETGTTTYTYDEMGNVLTVKNSGGTMTYAYDAMNRLRYKKNGSATYNISYYKDSNVKTVTKNNIAITYTYTDTGALASGDGATYKYDKYGNRSEMIKDDMVSRYSYDKNNRLIASFSQADAQTTHYTYDANGNMVQTLSYADNAQPYSTTQESIVVSETAPAAPTYNYYTFDVLGRMSSATVNGTTTNYTYDGNGLRQTKNNKQFVYDGVNIVWEGESLATGTTYYRGLELIAYKPQGRTRTFYKTDWHGNIEGYDYDDFGNPTGGNTLNPFRYNGEYYDEETGFIYLRARYYDPGVGRFVSEDPIRDGTNWYAYCANNPVNAMDPSGLAPFDLFASPDEAASDFGLFIGQKSIDEEEEYAACIYEIKNEDGNLYYYYDNPRNDLKTHEEREMSFSISWTTDPYALVHTHGAYDANTNNTKDAFSSPYNNLSGNPNMSDTSESDRLGKDYYVVTPAGNLRRYTANSGIVPGRLINANMPVDPRIAIHKQMKNTWLWNLLLYNFPNGKPQDYVNARLNNPNSLFDMLLELERFR